MTRRPLAGLAAAAVAAATTSCAALWGFEDAVVVADAGTIGDGAATESQALASTMGTATTVLVDALADVPPAPESAMPSAPCARPCAPGYECQMAVGSAAVCVASASTCADVTDCPAGGCCVWLDPSSASGRCMQSDLAVGGASCLCSGKQAGPKPASCHACELAPGQPSGGIEICTM